MQCPVLKYRLGLKTAPVQCTLKSRTDNGYRHILDRVTRGRKMAANGEVCVSQPGSSGCQSTLDRRGFEAKAIFQHRTLHPEGLYTDFSFI